MLEGLCILLGLILGLVNRCESAQCCRGQDFPTDGNATKLLCTGTISYAHLWRKMGKSKF